MAGRSELSMFEYLPKNVQSLPDLHQIALTGNTVKLSELLSQDSTIASSVDIYGRTALHLVSSHGVYYSLKLLCKYCSKEMLDRPDCYRYTALHYAAQGAHTHCAKLLLESGSDVNLTQHTQNTPLHLAALYAYPEMVALLCRHGADVHARNASQETPFQAATRSAYRNRGRVEFHCTILALILNSGSSVTVQDNEGITPLHHVAMYCEREQCTALLCAAGANVRRRNHGNITAAQLARIAATKRMLRKLRKTPPKLEHFCMLVIRQRLGTCLRTKAEQLPLPKALKDKLLHKTLSKVI